VWWIVDEKWLPIRAGVEISYIREKEQGWIESVIRDNEVTVTPAQAGMLRKAYEAGELTKTAVKQILSGSSSKPRKFVLRAEKLSGYFPEDVTEEEIEETIIGLLDEWVKAEH
jgi:ParB family chromosome partitioning protein